MKRWTNLDDLKEILKKKWATGYFLRTDCKQQFPLTIKINAPDSGELTNEFSTCQKWVQQFVDITEYQIEWKTVNHRKLGKNELPCLARFNNVEQVLPLIQKQRDFAKYKELSAALLETFPKLYVWLNQYPFTVLQFADHWTSLINITHWMVNNPRPNIYIRQIKVHGIDTKLIEQHKKLLTQWLDILLPDDQIAHQYLGLRQFENRFGFKTKPERVRIRILDSNLYIAGLSDLTLVTDEFHNLDININTIFVTENDINGLAFPDVRGAMILFGSGYGFSFLNQVPWLQNKTSYYWGDIDTHGFAILNQFRQYMPNAKSLLMDEQTLLKHKQQWVKESKPTQADLLNLTPAEHRLYNQLRYNQLQENLRLEQEYISYSSLLMALKRLQ